ncbi:MAG: hypothetical protein COV57_02690 [Candidatus Liptonbacteria bacterium CG11_big_fil_rev_8_21_14_0_20_35_14]|uniref:DUF5673 domain-containing protein n=1 Tax=Candidatus Liptonbacteria bacterium CG11_big_fil_rev_8_21_14_0_20_35_14 TaxID=1974634 RepID=A0A2H0N7A7_9BACT|nr:MAG: hypothetical protein COV57_02690 [Candidatus Liptonbacteria bacterium CG11_big_fil_rev_8_21_14_0_20_35_14]
MYKKFKKKTESIEFMSPEFEFFEKDIIWYAVSIFVSTIIVLFAIWQKNVLFAVFIVIAESILLFFGNDQPRSFKITADKTGLEIGPKFYSWNQLESFSIGHEKNETHSDLHFYKVNQLGLKLHLDIENKDVARIKSFLHNYLTEVEHYESLSETIMRTLRI